MNMNYHVSSHVKLGLVVEILTRTVNVHSPKMVVKIYTL